MQSNSFEFTVRIDLSGMKTGVHTGLAMFEKSASGLEVEQSGDERRISYFHVSDSIRGPIISQSSLQLRVRVDGDRAQYFYSLDEGKSFLPLGGATQIGPSWWKGPRPALFAYTTESAEPGSVDFDWANYQSLGNNPW
jgi:beta-xylosidase